MSGETWRVYFVVGEESGDALGADLIEAFAAAGHRIEAVGLAGRRMQALGMESLFDISDISVMGISAVVARLPTILSRISMTARDIVEKRPHAVVLIDSPDFNYRVAKRIRSKLPGVPIVKYICPSVWAWRPGRARTMARHIDHVLAILPFEPKLLKELGGPDATYVGHPLARRLAAMDPPDRTFPSDDPLLLVLPGSRRSETRLLLPDMRNTLEILAARGNRFRAVLPAVPKLEAEIRAAVAGWPVKPEIVTGEEAKARAFREADLALAASGTVLLELALYKVPAISIYRLDWLMHRIRFLITGWTAALPNLIADAAFLPERVGDMVRPGWLARALEELMRPGPARDALLEGYDKVGRAMALDEASGAVAARAIARLIEARKRNGS